MTTEDAPQTHFDFDYWRKLAVEDPQGFEAARRDALMAIISRAGEHRQQRLQGLQWQIDRIRDTAANPMAACVKISSMMWDKMLGDGGLLESLRRLEGIEPERLAERPPARVIPLPASRAPTASD